MRSFGFLFLLLTAAWASAQVGLDTALRFEHDTLTCISTDAFPLVEAELDPAELGALRKAQVYFKAGGTDAWYFVDMEPGEASRLRARLPRPLAETERVDYYLFFLSSSFEPSQSAELSVSVRTGCEGIPAAATSTPVSITLRATIANQSPIPVGFQPQGISGLVTTTGNTIGVGSAGLGGGGLSGATLGLVAGGAAATGAVVVATNGGDGDGAIDRQDRNTPPDVSQSPEPPVASSPAPPPTSPAPSPTPPPAPSLRDVSGTWILTDRVTESCRPELLGRTSTTGMVIQQNGGALTASRNGPNYTENLSGTIDTAGRVSLRGPFVDEGDAGEASWEATTSSGSDMTGRYSRFYPAHDCTVRWTFTGSKS